MCKLLTTLSKNGLCAIFHQLLYTLFMRGNMKRFSFWQYIYEMNISQYFTAVSYIYNPVTVGLYLGTFVSSWFQISHCYTQKFKYCRLLIASLYIVTKPSIRMVKKQLHVHSETCHVDWEWSIWPEVDHPTRHLKQQKTVRVVEAEFIHKNPHQGGFTCTPGIDTYK